MKGMLRRGLAALSSAAMLAMPFAGQAAVTESFNAGDLIKGPGQASVYYFAPDGKRYVFPNDKTYFTWYPNFDTVKLIPDSTLSTIRIGGNVTYRPGVKMVKVDTDPRTYAVDRGGVLRHVATEQLATTLYGMQWNQKIDDIPDPFFVNYRIGNPIEMASEYVPADVMTLTPNISVDKNMDPEATVGITIGSVANGFVPKTITIKRGTEVTWTNRDNMVHTVSSASFNSPDIQPDGTYKRTFSTVGSFEYRCGIHPTMVATINVVN